MIGRDCYEVSGIHQGSGDEAAHEAFLRHRFRKAVRACCWIIGDPACHCAWTFKSMDWTDILRAVLIEGKKAAT